MTDLTRAEGVVHAYGTRRVLDGAAVSVGAGEPVCLLGPNGAGKTTLARVISGVVRPGSGRVELGGESVFDLGRREIARRVAVVAQDPAVAFPFRVREITPTSSSSPRMR